MTKERTVSINVPMPESLKITVMRRAGEENMGMATLVRKVLMDYCGVNGPAVMKLGPPNKDV